jgi:hypothetical protein
MLFGGENPNKVSNIVLNNLERFEELYAPSFKKFSSLSLLQKEGLMFQVISLFCAQQSNPN